MKTWNEEWSSFRGPNFFGRMLYRAQKAAIRKALANVPKGSRVLDVGCGTGRTLGWLRGFGFDAIGIDSSESAIEYCSKSGLEKGKDVFVKDASKTGFADKSFDFVFSDGLLEHFSDFSAIVREMCRVSRKYVVVTQPNHFSLFGRVLETFTKKSMHEYTYRVSDFAKSFEKCGFALEKTYSYNFNEQWLLVFKRP